MLCGLQSNRISLARMLFNFARVECNATRGAETQPEILLRFHSFAMAPGTINRPGYLSGGFKSLDTKS